LLARRSTAVRKEDQHGGKSEDNLKGLEYLGCGPKASSGYVGWSRQSNIFYKCGHCNSVMQASTHEYFACKCGAMHLDIDAGKFASIHGDNDILVYRKNN
jgi:hypothetical protein